MADWREQSLRLWQNIGTRQRYIILGSAALIFIVVLGWSYWFGGKQDMVPLFTNMELQDAGEVQAKLKEMKTSFDIGGNGSAILVPAKDVYRIRLELASQGLPRGNKGFEIFDQNKFGATEFQNKVYLLQALQGELSRTIEQMSEVEKARVHIVMPEDSLYKKDEKPSTASIMLKLRPSAQLSREQVKGIVNLVAHSIVGLKPENITVVDSYAHVLNEQGDSPFGVGTGALTQLEMTKKVQDDIQKNLQSLLEQVLGPGKAAARVNVELNFDQKTTDKQVFEPVADDKGILRSSQDSSENYKGTAPSSGGVPGTGSNIPSYVTSGSSQSNTYEKKESTRNYEINETKEKIISTPGTIKRLTVAVWLDASIDRSQQDSITKVVSSAVGLNPTRGDAISVENISFSTELVDKQRKDELEYQKQEQQALMLKVGLAALIILLIIFGLRKLFQRRQVYDEELELVPTPLETQQPVEVKKKEISAKEKELSDQHEHIQKLAKSRPEDVAQLIKAWLADE